MQKKRKYNNNIPALPPPLRFKMFFLLLYDHFSLSYSILKITKKIRELFWPLNFPHPHYLCITYRISYILIRSTLHKYDLHYGIARSWCLSIQTAITPLDPSTIINKNRFYISSLRSPLTLYNPICFFMPPFQLSCLEIEHSAICWIRAFNHHHAIVIT